MVSTQTPMYSTIAFWKKRPIGQVYRKGCNVTSQTPVVSMTTRLIVVVTYAWKLIFYDYLLTACKIAVQLHNSKTLHAKYETSRNGMDI